MKLFISDLHLDETRPAIAAAFQTFLQTTAQGADALYILGDFFELWVGDDDDAPFVRQVEQWLAAHTAAGHKVYLMHGNRDFLIGEAFARRTGVTLLPDPTLIEVDHQRVVLMHGDSLCTADREYQAFRQQTRSAPWQQAVLAKSLAERRALGRQLREQSRTMSSRKAADIMDVTETEVTRVLHEHGASVVVHGHTHRPNRHSVADCGGCERIVLGDWDSHGWCLVYEQGNFDLQSWPIAGD